VGWTAVAYEKEIEIGTAAIAKRKAEEVEG